MTLILGNTDVSIPIPRNFKQLRTEIQKGVQSGKLQLGELIIPKTFKKFVMDTNGNIQESKYTICGRKIPIDVLRTCIYEKHNKYGIMRPTNGAVLNRSILVWTDHASILNVGHLLITTHVVYNPRIFYTDHEILEKTGKEIDIQEVVKSPEIYILGQTSESLAEKLTYSESRLDDVLRLKNTLTVDKQIIYIYMAKCDSF